MLFPSHFAILALYLLWWLTRDNAKWRDENYRLGLIISPWSLDTCLGHFLDWSLPFINSVRALPRSMVRSDSTKQRSFEACVGLIIRLISRPVSWIRGIACAAIILKKITENTTKVCASENMLKLVRSVCYRVYGIVNETTVNWQEGSAWLYSLKMRNSQRSRTLG